MIGERIGGYRIVGEIGSGGMATVYLGEDEELGRKVAIKVLHRHLMKNPEARERFLREAKAIAALNHKNIVKIYAYSGEGEGEFQYIVMEYVDGFTLGEFLAKRFVRFSEIAACIGIEIASGLEHAHAHGVIHRDLKPDNILISRIDGSIKLTDFGIARLLDAPRLTHSTAVIGSPAYMSPEIIEGEGVDAQSDIFSLGIMLYEMATGKLPFEGQTPHALLKAVFEGEYRNPEELNPLIAPEFTEVIRKCLQRDKAQRAQSATEVKKLLKAVCSAYEVHDTAELAAEYLTNPAPTEERFAEHLKSVLENKAQHAAQEGNLSEAIAHANRLFVLDPNNEVANRITSELLATSEEEEEDSASEHSAEPTDKTKSEPDEPIDTSTKQRLDILGWLFGLAALLAIILIVALAFIKSSETDTQNHPSSTPRHTAQASSLQTNKLNQNNKVSENNAPQTQQAEPLTDTRTHPATKPTKPQITPERSSTKVLTALDKKKLLKQYPLNPKLTKHFQVNTSQTATQKSWGTIEIVSFPWAQVYIDDKPVGTTRIATKFKVPLGEHIVKLVNPHCEPYLRIVKLTPDKPHFTLRQRLKLQPAYLWVEAPPGSKIYINGKLKGETPLSEQISIDWQQRSVETVAELVVELPGGQRKSKQINLVRGRLIKERF